MTSAFVFSNPLISGAIVGATYYLGDRLFGYGIHRWLQNKKNERNTLDLFDIKAVTKIIRDGRIDRLTQQIRTQISNDHCRVALKMTNEINFYSVLEAALGTAGANWYGMGWLSRSILSTFSSFYFEEYSFFSAAEENGHAKLTNETVDLLCKDVQNPLFDSQKFSM